MDKLMFEILDKMNEGIVILTKDLEIQFWNEYMVSITTMKKDDAIGNNIYQILPQLDKNHFRNAIQDVRDKGHQMFFSAAIHKELLNTRDCLNFKISRLEQDASNFILLEFINITNQIVQINQLKNYVKKLYSVNLELQEKEKIIKNLAYYDKLTGIANRTLFYKIAEKKLEEAKRSNQILGLMFIDVNKFKKINDNFGHEIGDKILIQVASILQNAIRHSDVVARYGGDEFLILLPHMKDLENYKEIAYRINHHEWNKFMIGDSEINISLSIGISFYPDDGDTIDQLVIKADEEMYIAKKASKE